MRFNFMRLEICSIDETINNRLKDGSEEITQAASQKDEEIVPENCPELIKNICFRVREHTSTACQIKRNPRYSKSEEPQSKEQTVGGKHSRNCYTVMITPLSLDLSEESMEARQQEFKSQSPESQ